MIFLNVLKTKSQALRTQIQLAVDRYHKKLNPYFSPVGSTLSKAYKYMVLGVSTFCNFLSFLIQSAADLILLIASKVITFSHLMGRKIYVWKILSARTRWYETRKGGYYNPKLKTTIYPSWQVTWNIVRMDNHYKGFESKENAEDVAFKMWMKKRIYKNRLNPCEMEIQLPLNIGMKVLPNKIRIRKASPKDASDLLILMESLGYPKGDENMKTRIQAYSYGSNNQIFVAERAHKVVGFVAFIFYDLFASEGKRCRIEELVVETTPSDLSVKRKLVQAVEDFAKDNNGKIVDLTSGLYFSEEGSHDFYKFLGYKNDNTREQMYFKKEL